MIDKFNDFIALQADEFTTCLTCMEPFESERTYYEHEFVMVCPKCNQPQSFVQDVCFRCGSIVFVMKSRIKSVSQVVDITAVICNECAKDATILAVTWVPQEVSDYVANTQGREVADQRRHVLAMLAKHAIRTFAARQALKRSETHEDEARG